MALNVQLKRRQAILDYLNEHGESTSRQIGGALGRSRGTINSYLRLMGADEEITSREWWDGRTMHVVYIAKVKATAANQKATVEELTDVTVRYNGGLVHRGTMRDHPMPSGGGQGALRHQWGIQSSAGLL